MTPPRLWITALLLVSISLLRVSAAADAGDPAKVVNDLYHSCLAHPGFDADIIKHTKPWVTPTLYARMLKKAKQQDAKGEVGDIDGDLFLDAQDNPLSLKVGQATIDGAKAKVDVTLIWSEKEKRHQTVLLEQVDGAWKVSDVIYADKGEGKLTDLL